MGTRIFRVEFEGEAIIELDDAVIDVVDDEWRKELYDLHSATDIAQHVAYNLVIRRQRLSSLDGWADQPDENAFVLDDPDWFVVATEEIS